MENFDNEIGEEASLSAAQCMKALSTIVFIAGSTLPELSKQVINVIQPVFNDVFNSEHGAPYIEEMGLKQKQTNFVKFQKITIFC